MPVPRYFSILSALVVGFLLSTFVAVSALADGPTVPNQDLTISVSLKD